MRSADELRRALKKIRRQGKSRYPSELKEEVGLWVARKRAEGMSQTAAVEALGSPWVTLSRWAAEATPRRVELMPIDVGEAVLQEEPASRIVLTFPGGGRVEGLGVDDIATLMRVLAC